MKMYLLHLKDEPHYVAQKYLLHQRFFQTAYIIGVTRAGMICTYSIGYYMHSRVIAGITRLIAQAGYSIYRFSMLLGFWTIMVFS